MRWPGPIGLWSRVQGAFRGGGRTPGSSNRVKGDSAEVLAYEFLKKDGYRIIARKYRRRFGEIDLIGWDRDILAFVEVKFRSQLEHGRPEEAVNRHKQRQICRVAREFRRRHHVQDRCFRYDIVSVLGSQEGPVFRLIKDAFKDTA
ncbi:MAG: YraN family protein [Acidobacteriota bacterium]